MAGKEYTTAPILVNADGHPIPQYLDITDTTDSPQGTFKPLTQLQAEHPDVQNVQLTGSNVELRTQIFNVDDTVSAGESLDLMVTPPGGRMWTIQGTRITTGYPDNATSGQHIFDVFYENYVYIAQLYANYDERIMFRFNTLEEGDLSKSLPSDNNALLNALKGLRITSATPLHFNYKNETDGVVTDRRSVRLTVLEEDII